MKITMDKRYTPVSKAKRVKEAMKEFKASYTENDILNLLEQSVHEGWKFDGKILDCEIEAFPKTSWDFDDDVCFRIEMITYVYHTGFHSISAVVESNMALVDSSHITVDEFNNSGYSHYFSNI